MSYHRLVPVLKSSNNLLIQFISFKIIFYIIIGSLIIIIIFKVINKLINIYNRKLREENITETEEIYDTDNNDVEDNSIKSLIISNQNNNEDYNLPSYSEIYSN